MSFVNFDHQSASPLLPEAKEALLPFLDEQFGNPSSAHRLGGAARKALSKAREQMAAFVGAGDPDEIVFTSGGTEAVNLAIRGGGLANAHRGRHVVLSEIEHPAVITAARYLEKHHGFELSFAEPDRLGRVTPDSLAEHLRDDTVLVACHLANHDIGTIQDVPALAAMTHERRAVFFLDATMAAGWLPLPTAKLGVDLMALSLHRVGGPKGVGVLVRHAGGRSRLVPQITGGSQEGDRRAGTENVPAIVGVGAAAEVLARTLEQCRSHVAVLQLELWRRLAGVLGAELHGPVPGQEREPSGLNVSFSGVDGEGLALVLDTKGYAVASGPSCVSRSLRGSPVLRAIGASKEAIRGNIRVSFGPENTLAEVDGFVQAVSESLDKLRSLSPVRSSKS